MNLSRLMYIAIEGPNFLNQSTFEEILDDYQVTDAFRLCFGPPCGGVGSTAARATMAASLYLTSRPHLLQ